MSLVKALFTPTATIGTDAIEVLPKYMNDLLKCDIANKILMYMIYIPEWKLKSSNRMMSYIGAAVIHGICPKKINGTKFNKVLIEYINNDGMVIDNMK